ncbi:MAG: ABC transporter permease [Oceanospirillaceae bacterium]|uniref:ABC transporter permease n=1 Tax=unclassified Thalassolituus TaxID=2624967 RepID=UPI000C0A5A5E|nr:MULTISPECIES: ABC transporter permease [unclassified Thalassolituus]MAK91498.1 ABC transporter permease [Thalassolituus sp.]MAS25554.1 ABC transporter permease [Oceanospirillaceae bacterium]MAX99126.1 ABC transporter permease [Oceanospirillaceae bacterium]MBL36200.1 ABC transporter permease [Oceanospirillaceae bacterium]MBS55100.1 ABC transporter permease [Oceanospirillaceae bacterium]|tara:strand:- start:451 stop:1425 length:975 start_codon:yes stop_codon:yes gene_type:complete
MSATHKPTLLENDGVRRSLLLSPAVIMIGIFLIMPLLMVLVFSFLQPGTYGGVIWEFSTDAYRQFFFEEDFLTEEMVFTPAYLEIFGASFTNAVIAVFFCFLVGFPTAYFIATRPARTQGLWLFAITIPYWVNLLIRTVSMLFIIRDQGPLNEFLLNLGIIDKPLSIAYTQYAVVLGLFYSYLPFMVLPLYAAIERFDFSLLNAAHDLYASRWKALRYVLFPSVRNGIIAGCLLVFIPSLGAFIAPDVLGGGKQLMIGNMIALQFQGSRNWPFGAAAAVILLTFVLCLLMFFAWRASKSSQSAQQKAQHKAQQKVQQTNEGGSH